MENRDGLQDQKKKSSYKNTCFSVPVSEKNGKAKKRKRVILRFDNNKNACCFQEIRCEKVDKSKSVEIIAGILHKGCLCEKKDGLQDQCPRLDCLDNPNCLTDPPTCGPCEYSNFKHYNKKMEEGFTRKRKQKEIFELKEKEKQNKRKRNNVDYNDYCIPIELLTKCMESYSSNDTMNNISCQKRNDNKSCCVSCCKPIMCCQQQEKEPNKCCISFELLDNSCCKPTSYHADTKKSDEFCIPLELLNTCIDYENEQQNKQSIKLCPLCCLPITCCKCSMKNDEDVIICMPPKSDKCSALKKLKRCSTTSTISSKTSSKNKSKKKDNCIPMEILMKCLNKDNSFKEKQPDCCKICCQEADSQDKNIKCIPVELLAQCMKIIEARNAEQSCLQSEKPKMICCKQDNGRFCCCKQNNFDVMQKKDAPNIYIGPINIVLPSELMGCCPPICC